MQSSAVLGTCPQVAVTGDHASLAYIVGIIAVIVYLSIGSLAGKRGFTPWSAAIGEDGRLSSSKFQFFIWTATIVWAYVALYVLHESVCRGYNANWSLPDNVLLAMGFSVVTLATAKGVTSSYVNSGRIAKTAATRRARLSDLVTTDDSGTPDLSKIQMLTWTLIAVGTYIATVTGVIASGTDPQTFPDIDKALMVLMGIGQGAYLGNKVVSQSGATLMHIEPSAGPVGTPVQLIGANLGNTSGTVLFGDARIAPTNWTATTVTFTIPNAGSGGAAPPTGAEVFLCVIVPSPIGVPQSSNTLAFKMS